MGLPSRPRPLIVILFRIGDRIQFGVSFSFAGAALRRGEGVGDRVLVPRVGAVKPDLAAFFIAASKSAEFADE